VVTGRALRPPAESDDSPWPRSATLVLMIEGAVLLVLNLAWLGTGERPGPQMIDVLLIAAAAALGMQSAAAKAIDGGPSTTYMTGALTTLVGALAAGRRPKDGLAITGGLAALVCGALCSAFLVVHCRGVALVPPLVAVVVVAALKAREHSSAAPSR
jgi:uncharacterized membrane protein YoaK (UPF0700 family)